MGGVSVHRMTPYDVEEVYTIEKLCFATPWSLESLRKEAEENTLARYIVAKIDGILVGYGGMWVIGDEGHITNVAVHPDYRGIGIGDKLVGKLIELARRESVRSMTLEVRRTNIVAQSLYKKYGFVVSGLRSRYYEDNGEDALIMWKMDV